MAQQKPKSKRETVAEAVFKSGQRRISTVEDAQFKAVFEATLKAAELLDEVAPAEGQSRADQVAAQRAKRATQRRPAAKADESTSGEIQ